MHPSVPRKNRPAMPGHRRMPGPTHWRNLFSCLVLFALSWTRVATQNFTVQGDALGNFDARLASPPASASSARTEAQNAALQALRAAYPAVSVTYDPALGVTRTVMNQAGYLTLPDLREPLQIAVDYIHASTDLLGLEPGDLIYEVTDVVPNAATGSTHVYFRQTHNGLAVYNAQLQVNVNREGRILSVNNQFVPFLASSANLASPAISASEAVAGAARHLNIPLAAQPQALEAAAGIDRRTRIGSAGISREPIAARLMYLPIQRGDVRLVWNFQIYTVDSQHWFDLTVDAGNAEVWTRFDWVAPDQYLVYPQPLESPQHTTPLPPDDGRVIVVDPADPTASPFGWHDTDGVPGPEFTIHRGNNVHAYEDINRDNAPPPSEPDCGFALLCTFGIDLTLPPNQYIPAAVTNLFYWNNVLHDVQYQYGFTELAGNFQVNNYGRGGLGNDSVQAEAQDGSGINNANFSTPPDGMRPRMQMFIFTAAEPDRDGDLDAGIVVHEYGHGISNRLVGGPSNVSCLTNTQQPGEGLSDWWSLVYTAREGDVGTMGRGMGTYALNQPTTGPGVRVQRYSTDPAINTWTYASISGLAIPHGVGSVWAQAAWEMYWALVDQHGFDPNLYNAAGQAGNQRAMLYVNEGLMNSVCRPTFTDVRDGILQAAMDNHGGEDVCLLWSAFAGFGLGADAVSGGPNSTAPTNGFGIPGMCVPAGSPSLSVGDATVSEPAGSMTFDVSLSAPSAGPVRVNYATADGTAVSTPHGLIFDNDAAISIPSSGPAPPYPSSINIATSPGPIAKVQARLNGLNHVFPGDVDVLLQGPGGQTVVLMSDVNASSVTNVTLTFSDTGATMPTTGALVTGTYRPTDNAPTETFPAPAPAGPHASALSIFNGRDPVGAWNLYVFDDLSGGPSGALGSISGGWSLILSTTTEDFTATAGSVTFAPGETIQTISVPIINNSVQEPTETFSLHLSDPINATLGDPEAIGTITDDDGGGGTPPNPRADLVLDFGAHGLWVRYNHDDMLRWSQIHLYSPSLIASGNLDGNARLDLLAVFAGYGTWLWMNDEGWSPLHPGDPTDVEFADLNHDGVDEIVLNFPGYGIWIREANEWRQLHLGNSAHLAAANIDGDAEGRDDVIVDFPGYGVWAWMNDSSWVQVHPLNVAAIQAGDFNGDGVGDLAMDFPGFGLYTLSNGQFTLVTTLHPDALVAGNIDGDTGGRDELVGSFPGYGTWVWRNNEAWTQLHAHEPSVMSAGDVDADGRTDVVMGFAGYGLWLWRNDTAFEHVHALVPEAIAVGRLDDAFRFRLDNVRPGGARFTEARSGPQ
jgi:extracellular elastinolytic metalloproteinase